MKPIILITSILFLMMINFSCLKDEVEASKEKPITNLKETPKYTTEDIFANFTGRNGVKPMKVYYKRYSTTDNFLLGGDREHEIYNRNLFDSVFYQKISSQTAQTGNQQSGWFTIANYNITHYRNDTIISNFDAIAEYVGETYLEVIPNPSGSLMANSVTAYKTSFKKYRNVQPIFNIYRLTNSNLWNWEIKADGVVVNIGFLRPENKNSVQWAPNHQF